MTRSTLLALSRRWTRPSCRLPCSRRRGARCTRRSGRPRLRTCARTRSSGSRAAATRTQAYCCSARRTRSRDALQTRQLAPAPQHLSGAFFRLLGEDGGPWRRPQRALPGALLRARRAPRVRAHEPHHGAPRHHPVRVHRGRRAPTFGTAPAFMPGAAAPPAAAAPRLLDTATVGVIALGHAVAGHQRGGESGEFFSFARAHARAAAVVGGEGG